MAPLTVGEMLSAPGARCDMCASRPVLAELRHVGGVRLLCRDHADEWRPSRSARASHWRDKGDGE